MTDWFSAHKDGLRQIGERLVERRGFGILGGELYQNVADTNATRCDISITPMSGLPRIEVMVTDNNPTGFKDLTHAWMVFAPSEKKGDPTKAGRFNLGEKMVLAFCRNATIHTTSGTVVFDDKGRQEYPRRKRDEGTVFLAEMDCTRERLDQLITYFDKILVRKGLDLCVNGRAIETREPIHSFQVALPTEIGDDLRPTVRQTTVEIYEPQDGETPMLYELGIPVVETGDKWHVNVLQKVPLNVDRDNVTPSYLRKVRVAVLNEMHAQISVEDTTATWVKEATEDPNVVGEAMKTVLDKQFGEKRVAFDPGNPDANAAAQTSGYTVIPSRSISSDQRTNARRFNLIESSSAVFPHLGKGVYSDDPDAPPVDVVPESDWTEGMRLMHDYSIALAMKLLEDTIHVRFVRAKSFVGRRWAAAYGHRHLDFNVFVLGRGWFNQGLSIEAHRLLIHEFAHHFESNHATDEFHRACCRLGAKLAEAVMDDPAFFRNWKQRFAKLKQGDSGLNLSDTEVSEGSDNVDD